MTLKSDLELLNNPVDSNPYQRYFLSENPFPGYGETRSDVCTDQASIKWEFIKLLRNDGHSTKRLRIHGESGAGKTNILRYFEHLTNEARSQGRIGAIYPIYVYAPGDGYLTIHEQIITQLTEFLLGDLIITLRKNPELIDPLVREIQYAPELLIAIKAIVEPTLLAYPPYEERQIYSFIRWLKGDKLTLTDKKLLDERLSELKDARAIRSLNGLLQILNRVELCDGIVILFDEFEEIFAGLSRVRQSLYAVSLRHLFDTLQELTCFVVATIPEPRDLAQYPAIARRLGDPLLLEPIRNVEVATAYVQDYLDAGREQFFEATRKQFGPQVEQAKREEFEALAEPLMPLTRQQVAEAYQTLANEAAQAGLDVLPGYFLPRMRQLLQSLCERDD